MEIHIGWDQKILEKNRLRVEFNIIGQVKKTHKIDW